MSCDPYYSYVKALLHFDGTDGATTTTDATGLRTWTRAGQAQIDTAQSVFGGSASLFDGNGDYWYTSDSNDSNIGTGDFTIECRIRIAGASAVADAVNNNRHMAIFGTDAGSTGWQLFVIGTTTKSQHGLGFECKLSGVSGGISWYPVDAADDLFALNTWYAIAITRCNGFIRLFVDGRCVATTYSADNIQGGSTGMRIGSSPTSSYVRHFNGWIEELRFTNGKARYVDDYTVETAAFEGACGAHPLTFSDSVSAQVYADDFVQSTPIFERYGNLLLHMEGTAGTPVFRDEYSGLNLSYYADPALSAAQHKFGSTSAYTFDDALFAPGDKCLDFGADDWTIEGYFYQTSVQTYNVIVSRRHSRWDLLNYFQILLDSSGRVVVQVRKTSGFVTNITTNASVNTATWTHIAIVREAGEVRIYINGVRGTYTTVVNSPSAYGSPSSRNANINGSPIAPLPEIKSAFFGGSYNGEAWGFRGYVDEFRLTRGVARYLADFTPPVAPFNITVPLATASTLAWDMRSYLDSGLAVAWDMVSWFENSQQLQWGRSADFMVRRCISWGVLMPVTKIARPMVVTPSASGNTLTPVHKPAALNGGLSSCED